MRKKELDGLVKYWSGMYEDTYKQMYNERLMYEARINKRDKQLNMIKTIKSSKEENEISKNYNICIFNKGKKTKIYFNGREQKNVSYIAFNHNADNEPIITIEKDWSK